jgi:hypothetical protein
MAVRSERKWRSSEAPPVGRERGRANTGSLPAESGHPVGETVGTWAKGDSARRWAVLPVLVRGKSAGVGSRRACSRVKAGGV